MLIYLHSISIYVILHLTARSIHSFRQGTPVIHESNFVSWLQGLLHQNVSVVPLHSKGAPVESDIRDPWFPVITKQAWCRVVRPSPVYIVVISVYYCSRPPLLMTWHCIAPNVLVRSPLRKEKEKRKQVSHMHTALSLSCTFSAS